MSLAASIADILASAGTIASIASILASAATIALVFLTWRYVSSSKLMLIEMREARLQEYRPDIVVDFETTYDHWSGVLVFLVVRNAGRRAARSLRFVISPNPQTTKLEEVRRAAFFGKGVDVFSPGRTLRYFYSTLYDLFAGGTSAKEPFEVTALYTDSVQGPAQDYEETFNLDPGQFSDLPPSRGVSP